MVIFVREEIKKSTGVKAWSWGCTLHLLLRRFSFSNEESELRDNVYNFVYFVKYVVHELR
jgi:hypothetical protein